MMTTTEQQGLPTTPLRHIGWTPFFAGARQLSVWLWRFLQHCIRHWKSVLISSGLLLPLFMFLWIFAGITISRTQQGILFHLHWNTPQQSFTRLAQLVGLEQQDRLYLQTLADATAARYGIDPPLFRALITQESAWNPDALSPRGMAGLTQLMPDTAQETCGLLANDRFDPAKNLNCGALYLSQQLHRFKSVDLALAAYNAGPTRVAKLGRIPRIAETQTYVSRIMENWQGAS